MFDLDKWQEIFATIAKNKLRTGLTAFGVFWGIFMLIILLGAGKGLQNGVAASMLLDATNSIWFVPQRTSIPYKGMNPGRRVQLTEEDLEVIERSIEGIDLITPENFLSGDYRVSKGKNSGRFQLYAAKADYFPIKVTYNYVNGRPLNEYDDEYNRKVCNIGNRVAEVLFEGSDPIGEYIRIRDVLFKVVGVYNFEGQQWGQDERVFIPFSTFKKVFQPSGKVNLFAVTTDQTKITGKELQANIQQIIYQRHNVHPDDNQAFFIHNQEEQYNQVMGLMSGIRAFVWVIGIFTLLAGIMGISNIMMIVVKDRTREIGIRKAIGARPGSIVSMILQESIFITAIAGYVGLVLGTAFLEGLNYLLSLGGAQNEYFRNPEIDLTVAISATLLLIFAGAMAGLIPALKASKINPIDALRVE
jgi:putative ABC transport system permease protein